VIEEVAGVNKRKRTSFTKTIRNKNQVILRTTLVFAKVGIRESFS
jgi:hypothetical protein